MSNYTFIPDFMSQAQTRVDYFSWHWNNRCVTHLLVSLNVCVLEPIKKVRKKMCYLIIIAIYHNDQVSRSKVLWKKLHYSKGTRLKSCVWFVQDWKRFCQAGFEICFHSKCCCKWHLPSFSVIGRYCLKKKLEKRSGCLKPQNTSPIAPNCVFITACVRDQ